MNGPLIKVRDRHQIRIERNGPDVALLFDGRRVFEAHYTYAEQVGKALIENAMACRLETQVLTRPRVEP